MKHISFILRKIAFTFASALIFIFFSCAAFDSDKTTSLTLSFNGSQFFSSDRSASREAVTSDYNLVISLLGDSTETKVISGLNKSGSYSVTFDNVKVGNTLYVRTDLYNTSAYIYDRENQTYPHIFTGTSSPLTVKSGKNTVSLKMKDMTKGDSKWSYRVQSQVLDGVDELDWYTFQAYSNGKYQVIYNQKTDSSTPGEIFYLLSEGTWRGDENTNILYLTECSYYNSGSERAAFVSVPEEKSYKLESGDGYSFTFTGANGFSKDFTAVSLTGDDGEEAGWSVIYDEDNAVSETTETTVTSINYTFEFYYADSEDGEYTLQSSRTVTGTAAASEAEEITGRDLSDYLKNWLLAMSEGYEENSSKSTSSQEQSETTLVYNRKEYYYKAFSSYLLNAASESGYNFFVYGGSSGGYTTVPYFVTDSEGLVVSYGSCDLDYSATNPDNLETISIFEYNYLDADSETYKSVEDSTKYTEISVSSGTTFTFSGSDNTTINGTAFTISS